MNRPQPTALALSIVIAFSLSADGTRRSCSKAEMEKCKRPAAEAATLKTAKRSDVAADRVSFYQIGLVCAAAPKIGCGTMAKPALLALTGNSRVAGAWLSEAGTRLAIAWKENAKPLTVDQLDAVLDPHGLAVQPISDAKHPELLATFVSDTGWFDAASVDRLSEQESGILAARLVKRLAARTSVTNEQQSRLHAAFDRTLRLLLTAGTDGERLDTEKLLADVEKQLLTAAAPHVDSAALSALRDAIALGYQPLPNED